MHKPVLMSTIIIFFIGCASFKSLFQPIPYYPITFGKSKNLYPAVIGAFNYYGFKIEKMNILRNEYESNATVVNKFYRTQMSVFTKGDTLHTRINKVETWFDAEQRWQESILSAGLSKNEFGSEFLATVQKILTNDTLYAKIKNNLLNSFDFNYTIMEDMSEVAREKWIKDALQDRIYNWELEMDEFEHNGNQEFPNYKYTARFNYKVKEGYFLLSDRIYLRLYTNNDDLSNFSVNTIVAAKGKLKKLTKDNIGSNYYFYLVDNEI